MISEKPSAHRSGRLFAAAEALRRPNGSSGTEFHWQNRRKKAYIYRNFRIVAENFKLIEI
jgi:hypothetical protein